jgi:hypothetical protein
MAARQEIIRERRRAMSLEQSGKHTGSAYALKPSTYDEDLTLVTKGTRGGELLRRYWHPIALVSEV